MMKVFKEFVNEAMNAFDIVRKGNVHSVRELLDGGFDVNVPFLSGERLLHTAAIEGHKEVAEFLLSKGANVNAKENLGWTPLRFAVSKGHKEVAELLCRHGGKE